MTDTPTSPEGDSTNDTPQANTATEHDAPTPSMNDITEANGPMTSMLYDPESTVNAPKGPNRDQRRAQAKKNRKTGIGPEHLARATQERIETSQQEKRVREMPDDLRDLLARITTPEVAARTKDRDLSDWTRSDALNLFTLLASAHARMMKPMPASKDDIDPPAVQIIQAGDSLGVFYPVTFDSKSHILITVSDPRHFLSAAERPLRNDAAIDALSGVAEKMVVGLYSLSGSLLPGSDAHEITDLMSQLTELNPDG